MFSKLRRERKPVELMLVPMIDIFTVMVTFLLMTAVFSRITTLELDLPSAAGGAVTEPVFRLEAILRKDGFELTNGTAKIAAIPKVDGEYDLKTLSQLAVSLKRDHPGANDASVLLEPEIEYDDLIQVMDTLRRAELPASELVPTNAEVPADGVANALAAASQTDVGSGDAALTTVALFTNIAVGDAP